MRESFLPFAVPDIGQEELAEIADAIESGWITTGSKTQQFERDFASRVDARHAVAVSSCTAAMHLAIEAIGVGSGDEVITTPYTFASTAEVVCHLNARPVFVDIDPRSLNLDPERLEAAITNRTKAILPVHIGGLPSELDEIEAVARRHRLTIVHDAAHAFQASYKGRAIGSTDHVTCFSFYATKSITTGEGGMICTSSADLAERCRRMAQHGISKDAWHRQGSQHAWSYEVAAPGYKYNMSDISAAMGLAQLRKAAAMAERRCRIALRYNEVFGRCSELQTPHAPSHSQHAWHLYVLRLHLDRLTIDRDEFIQKLTERNICTSVHFIPLHVHRYYRKKYGYQAEDFPAAYEQYCRAVSLPIYSKMDDRDVQDVIDAVLEILQAHARG